MGQGKKEEAEQVKAQVQAMADEMKTTEEKETELSTEIKQIMMQIPNMIDPSVPIGKMIVKMLNLKNSVNLLFLILKFLITQKLWKPSKALT